MSATTFEYIPGYIVTNTDHTRKETRQEIQYPQTREEDAEPRFTIKWYVNGENTYTISTLRASQVYDECITNEMLNGHLANRWHVLMRHQAMTRMLHCNIHSSFTLCFQDKPNDPELDTEMILVTREYGETWYE
jgi:hypothetical protein